MGAGLFFALFAFVFGRSSGRSCDFILVPLRLFFSLISIAFPRYANWGQWGPHKGMPMGYGNPYGGKGPVYMPYWESVDESGGHGSSRASGFVSVVWLVKPFSLFSFPGPVGPGNKFLRKISSV